MAFNKKLDSILKKFMKLHFGDSQDVIRTEFVESFIASELDKIYRPGSKIVATMTPDGGVKGTATYRAKSGKFESVNFHINGKNAESGDDNPKNHDSPAPQSAKSLKYLFDPLQDITFKEIVEIWRVMRISVSQEVLDRIENKGIHRHFKENT